jgi:hypothetical protein
MRRFIVLVAVLTILPEAGAPVLEACGAKFLVALRTARFQRVQRATRPAHILLYQHDSEAGVVEFMSALQGALQTAGHKVTLVTSETALRETASATEVNVVMLQLDAARRLHGSLTSWSPGASILPMKAFVTRAEAARAKKEFGHMLPLPTKVSQLFSTVESAHR